MLLIAALLLVSGVALALVLPSDPVSAQTSVPCDYGGGNGAANICSGVSTLNGAYITNMTEILTFNGQTNALDDESGPGFFSIQTNLNYDINTSGSLECPAYGCMWLQWSADVQQYNTREWATSMTVEDWWFGNSSLTPYCPYLKAVVNPCAGAFTGYIPVSDNSSIPAGSVLTMHMFFNQNATLSDQVSYYNGATGATKASVIGKMSLPVGTPNPYDQVYSAVPIIAGFGGGSAVTFYPGTNLSLELMPETSHGDRLGADWGVGDGNENISPTAEVSDLHGSSTYSSDYDMMRFNVSGIFQPVTLNMGAASTGLGLYGNIQFIVSGACDPFPQYVFSDQTALMNLPSSCPVTVEPAADLSLPYYLYRAGFDVGGVFSNTTTFSPMCSSGLCTPISLSGYYQWKVNFLASPAGSGTVTPSGVGYYNESTLVSGITAYPNSGKGFLRWSTSSAGYGIPDGITLSSDSSNPTDATVKGPGNITAFFAGASGTSVICGSSITVEFLPTTCTATVTGASPTGVVYWTQGGTGSVDFSPMPARCVLSTVSGVASCSVVVTGIDAGPVALKASYGGDPNNGLSNGGFTLTVTSPLTVSCYPETLVVGAPTVCTTTVTGSSTLKGNIVWSTSGVGRFSTLACKLKNGACSVEYTTRSVGFVNITAHYSGLPAYSETTSLSVDQAPSTTKVYCSPTSVVVGLLKTVKCIARVTGYKPTGIVTWAPSLTSLVSLSSPTCTLAKDSCSVTMKGVQAGTFTITASYSGDGNNTGSTSNSVSLSIKPVKTRLSVSCTSSSVAVGSAVTCTATLTGYYGSVSGETISWSQEAGKGSVSFPSPPTCTLSSAGTCTITVTGVSPRSVKIEAVYAGDQNNIGSSKSISLKVT